MIWTKKAGDESQYFYKASQGDTLRNWFIKWQENYCKSSKMSPKCKDH